MSRDPNGNYTLPLPPVTSGTVIATTWANPTTDDIAVELTDSFSRSGKGAMLAPAKHLSGIVSLPGITFNSDITSGQYLANSGDIRMSIAGVDVMQWTAGSAKVWDGAMFNEVLTTGSATTDDITNNSNVTGTTATDAFNFIDSYLFNLGSDEVQNFSSVPGTTVTDAFDLLDGDSVSDVSSVFGSSVTDTINTLGKTSVTTTDLVSSSDVYIPIPILNDSFSIASGARYKFEASIEFEADTSGIEIQFTMSSSTGGLRCDWNPDSTTTPSNLQTLLISGVNPTISIAPAETAGTARLTITGVFQASSTGAVGVDVRRQTAAGSFTVKEASTIQISRYP